MLTPHPLRARLRRLLLALATAAALAAPAARASAPEPPPLVGRSAHFTFHAHPDDRASLDRVMQEAEARYARVCDALGACDALDGPVEVWVAEAPERFAAAFPHDTPMSEWAAGVAFIGARRVVLRAHGSALFSLLETFDHEVAHLLVPDLAGGSPVPRWASEGLAIWASGEDLVARLDAAHRAAVFGHLMPLSELDARFPDHGPRVAIAYAQSALFTRHLVRRYGPTALPRVLARVASGEDFDAAFLARFGAPAASLALDWTEELEADTSPFILMRDGSWLWLLMTVVFIYVGVKQRRDRQRALADLPDEDPDDTPAAEAELAFHELEARRAAGEPPTLH